MNATKSELALIIATFIKEGLNGLESIIKEETSTAEADPKKTLVEQEQKKQTPSRKSRPASAKQQAAKTNVADDDDHKEITQEVIRQQARIIMSAYGKETAYAPFKEYGVRSLTDLTPEQFKELYETHKKMIKDIDHKAA
jgi:hypothetical protein